MKKILFIGLLLLAAVIGGGGGYFFKISNAEKNAPSTEPNEKKESKKKSVHEESKEEDISIFKFSRQFVVPVLVDRKPQYMVILEINLEMSTSSTSGSYAKESQVRDAVLEALFELAADGVLGGLPGEIEARAIARSTLLKAARSVLGEDVRNVLIQDVGIQRY
ncbi:MAG: hypothetical protein AAGJ73_07030 [Pseudomonadota bacterium]